MKSFFFIAAFSFALLAGPAIAEPNNGNDEIVVTGERLRSVLRDFVGSIAASPRSSNDNQLGRWDHKVCPAVIGLTHANEAQAIIDRIALRARQVGLDAEASGCRANLLVFVTPDADRLAEAIVRTMNDWIQPTSSYRTNTLGAAELSAFIASDDPVRWWHVLQTVSADGQRLQDRMRTFGHSYISQPVSSFAPPQLLHGTRQDFRSVLVIVDARQAQGYGLDSLGDYLAMVSLAQLRADADMSSYPTVLNLFSSPNAPRTMTDWDVAYLNGLYHAQRNALNARRQESEIADRMTQTLGQNEDHASPPATDAPPHQ